MESQYCLVFDALGFMNLCIQLILGLVMMDP
jgi:hypothetical protein